MTHPRSAAADPEWTSWVSRISSEDGITVYYGVGMSAGVNETATREAAREARFALSRLVESEVTLVLRDDGPAQAAITGLGPTFGDERVRWWKDETKNVTHCIVRLEPASPSRFTVPRPDETLWARSGLPAWIEAHAEPSFAVVGDNEVYTAVGRAELGSDGSVAGRQTALVSAIKAISVLFDQQGRCRPVGTESPSERRRAYCRITQLEVPAFWVDGERAVYVFARAHVPRSAPKPERRPEWVQDGMTSDRTVHLAEERAGVLYLTARAKRATSSARGADPDEVRQAHEAVLYGVCGLLYDFGLVRWPTRYERGQAFPCLARGVQVDSWVDEPKREIHAWAQVKRRTRGRSKCSSPEGEKARSAPSVSAPGASDSAQAEEPPVRFQDLVVAGTRSSDEILGTLRAQAAKVARCRPPRRQKGGSYRVRFNIGRVGRVRKLRTLHQNMEGDPARLITCANKVLTKTRFRRSRCTTKVAFDLVFSDRVAGPASGLRARNSRP